MQQFLGVNILDGTEKILDDEGCGLFGVPFLLLHLQIELSLRRQLHENVDILLIAEAPVHINYVGVVQVGLDAQLSDQLLEQVIFYH